MQSRFKCKLWLLILLLLFNHAVSLPLMTWISEMIIIAVFAFDHLNDWNESIYRSLICDDDERTSRLDYFISTSFGNQIRSTKSSRFGSVKKYLKTSVKCFELLIQAQDASLFHHFHHRSSNLKNIFSEMSRERKQLNDQLSLSMFLRLSGGIIGVV